MIIECNTASLDERKRTEIWREKVFCAYGSVKVELMDRGENLYGQLRSGQRDQFRFNSLRYRGQSHHRTPADIARLSQEYITLTRPYTGRLHVNYGNSDCVLEPSNIYLFNHATPYFAKPENEYGTTSIAFPASALRQRGLKVQPLHVLPAASHQGLLIGALADQIAASYAAWSDSEFAALSEQMLDLFALLFGQKVNASAQGESSVRAAHLHRALACIRANFGDPGLTPSRIALACGISVSYLHNLFRATDTSVEAAVIAERLGQSRKLLADAKHAHLPIGTIAYMCGFSHPAHFSRAFRSSYGCSPREVRDSA